MTRYFITGTAGFIGFHLANRLLAEGHEVTGYDGLTAYYDTRLKEARHAALARFAGFTAVTAMLEDFASLKAAFAAAAPDVVIHLAAQAGVRYSLEHPRSYVNSNLVGSFNLLELAKRADIRHLMLASTSSVYGANEAIPFRECDKADEPLTIYAASKRAMELMAHSMAHLTDTPTTCFRFFTVYGPWGRPDMALFKFVRAILSGEEIEIYGEGRMSRDFTYVDDLVEAILRLAPLPPVPGARIERDGVVDTLSPQGPFRVVNIGGGQPVGLLDFVTTIERVIGRAARRKLLPMQDGDVPRTFAAPDLLEALTGYRPHTGLEVGVTAFVDWYRQACAAKLI
ncbi:NAD-dependent epimerase/dehydratase family protein [Jiella sp. MQZ9-1]|uniref:NAD-dependent epimerase/dehydratase family protein n=1 Tax=Jiella flava TaxID=2816857 RepID=A0A939FY60_9HYPH|nr:NAD-dependent epimerase/dehydratase family protein [Jiella flava]MBO0663039.1 NAD-dependent epimerase/dehydratase family protein [Jiella flava]MCD2471458.1 NAD-dependent epimerase/dehydratase family protein [Jiella flava]